jgi:chitinase
MYCQPGYGNCHNVTVLGSFSRALEHGQTDLAGGGQYYWDPEAHLFWTWDTPELIVKKYEEIVKGKGLGGIMAWSLGEDSADWSRLAALAEMLKKKPDETCIDSTYLRPGSKVSELGV